jgi:hypothetical protein
MDATIWNIERFFGWVAPTASFLQALNVGEAEAHRA